MVRPAKLGVVGVWVVMKAPSEASADPAPLPSGELRALYREKDEFEFEFELVFLEPTPC